MKSTQQELLARATTFARRRVEGVGAGRAIEAERGESMATGRGEFRFSVAAGWGQGADGRVFGGVTPAVAADSRDRVYIARREPAAILVYDREGRYLNSWGEELLKSPHSAWFDDEDRLYVADVDDHTVRIFDTDGRVLQTLGTPGEPGWPGQPFNRPTWAARAPWGELYVADGYGQHRIHRFAADGRLIDSWGEEGAGPGQFALPHGLRIDSRGRVLVLDRENRRLQIFDADGIYQGEWPDLEGPNDLFIDAEDNVYVAEGNYRISVLDLDGNVLARWGEHGTAPGQFANGPHGLWVDSRGDLYVAEVPFLENRLQKFTRA